MTNWERIVRWTDWQGVGLEHLSVVGDDKGAVAESVVIGEQNAYRFGLGYRLGIDLQWRVRDISIRMAGGSTLRVLADGLGCWRGADGTEIPHLAGCIDIDIAATPFTNTLPIRRLKLDIGASATIKVAYVSLPTLTIQPVEQRYTRLAESQYLYEGLSTSFSAELTVDAQGIVGDYPGVFRLVP